MPPVTGGREAKAGDEENEEDEEDALLATPVGRSDLVMVRGGIQ